MHIDNKMIEIKHNAKTEENKKNVIKFPSMLFSLSTRLRVKKVSLLGTSPITLFLAWELAYC